MSATAAITCPSCENALNVPVQFFGKKIKCKQCGHAFVVQDPGGPAGKPRAKSAAVSPPPPPPPPPTPTEPKKRVLWDDEDEEASGGMAKPLGLVEDGSEIPRCPHCAKELEPPDAKVCIHCGFNNVTRAKANTVKVWAPTAEDWIRHLLPGILALAIAIGLIVLNIITATNMREWLEGSFLESDDKDASGRKKLYVAPGAFIFFLAAISLMIFVPAAKFAFKRLVKEYRPTERIKL
jgi:ribosomal protein L37E